MKTQTVKDFYNTALQNNPTPYEQERWFTSAQRKAGYMATKKAMEKYALPHLDEGMSVFELGPGPGTWTKVMLQKAPGAKYQLVDISAEMLKQAREALSSYDHILYTTSDILDYHVSNAYDFFFSSRILEYVPEKEIAIKNIVQAMRPGAYGYLVTKMSQDNRPLSKNKSSEIHAFQISPNDLSSLLLDNGCIIHNKVLVTCVFPKMKNGFLDSILTSICQFLPFSVGKYVSESYALVFQKK